MSRHPVSGLRRLLAALLLVSLLGAPRLARADDGDWERLQRDREQATGSLTQVVQLQKDALGQLFTLQLVADAAKTRQITLQNQIGLTLRQMDAGAAQQVKLEARAAVLQTRLAVRLRYYQAHGNGGYIDVILGSRSLHDLLNRAKLIWMILRGDLSMLGELHDLADDLMRQDNQLTNLAVRQYALQADAAATAAKVSAALAGQQALLVKLADQAGAYQTELTRLSDLWHTGAQAKLAIFGAAFARLPSHAADLKPDVVQLKIFPTIGAVVTLKQETLNAFMKKEADLADLALVLDGTSADLVGKVQDVPLVLHGRFVAEPTVLRYDLLAADFAGFSLPPEALVPLQQSGQLAFDLTSVLSERKWVIHSLTEAPGQLSAEVGGK